MSVKSRKALRAKRHRRVRRKVSGTVECPRMAIFVSNRHMYVQFIDDAASVTMASASSAKDEGSNNVEMAGQLGVQAAKSAQEKGIACAVVDRGGFRFHGRVKQIVDSAVENGLKITKEAKTK